MSDADAYSGSIAELLVALRDDPVHVEQTKGLGHTSEIDAGLTGLVGRATDAGETVYLALVGDVGVEGGVARSGSQVVAERLADELGDDAWIYVATADQTDPGYLVVPGSSTGARVDEVDAILDALEAAYTAADDARGDTGEPVTDPAYAGLVAAAVASDGEPVDAGTIGTLSGAPWAAAPPPAPPQGVDLEQVVLFSTLAGVLVALVVWRLVRSWVGLGAARSTVRSVLPAGAAEPAYVEAINALVDGLGAEVGHERADDAMSCRVLAERLIDSDDALDRVGALVLARTGLGLLETGRVYRPCLVNPLHGEARRAVLVPSAQGSELDVPVCGRCATDAGTDAGRGATPSSDPLMEVASRWRGARPYLDGDTVWARTGFGALDDALWQTVWTERRRGRR